MKTLFFIPYSATWDAALAEALIADAIKKKGNEVCIVTCNGMLKSYCIAMAARNIRHESSIEKKSEVCIQCKSNRGLLKNHFGFRSKSAEEYLTPQDFSIAQEMKNRVTRENYISIECDGHPIGRYALYEVLIHNKKSSLSLNQVEWNHYLDALENTVLSLKAAQKAFELEKPERFIVFSSMYSTNHVWKKEAERRKIIPYQIQGPASMKDVGLKFTIGRDDAVNGITFYSDALNKWPIISKKPITKSQGKMFAAHYKHIIGAGAYVYSPRAQGRNIRSIYNLSNDKPLFVAPLSSLDEVIAAEIIGYPPLDGSPAFASQVEWIRELIQFFINKPNWQLLIRPHPRMFSTTNNKVVSEEGQAILKLCQSLPENIKVNAPADGISTYEVLQEADVVLNAWSTVGTEAAVFGLPVLLYSSATWFPDEINTIAKTPQEYFQKMSELLEKGIDLEKTKKILRWLTILFDVGVLDLSRVFLFRGHNWRKKIFRRLLIPGLFLERKVPTTVFEKAELKYAKLNLEQIDLINDVIVGNRSSIIEPRLDLIPKISEEEEKQTIKKLLRYLLKISSNHKVTRLTNRLGKALREW